jgi:hypothetical protein
MALAAIVLSGCGAPEEPPAEPSESPEAPAEESIREIRPASEGALSAGTGEGRDRFLDSIHQRIAELEPKVEVFKAKAQAKGDAVKAEYDKFRADWDAKVKAVRDKLDSAATVAGSAWQDTKKELEDALDEIKKVYAEAEKKFK